MPKKPTRYLNKPLSQWSDDEITDLVALVDKVKNTPLAQPLIKRHMSLGTYRRALRRIGRLPPKVKTHVAGDGCICQRTIAVKDLVLGLLSALNISLSK